MSCCIETSRESRARSAGRECEISCTYRKIKGQSLEVISGLCFFLVQENDVVYTIKINFLFSYLDPQSIFNRNGEMTDELWKYKRM